MMSGAFHGFRPEAVRFLVELAEHNDRAWFQPRKAEYERLLKEPLEALCVALDGAFAARDVPLTSDPKRSPFRIHRDVRFSRDKSPYKTQVSASFPWSGDGGMVGGYFHLEPGAVFVGGGMWHPAPERLAGWRRAVTEDRAMVHATLDDAGFRRTFGHVTGERLKRGPAGFRADDPDIELLKLKDVTFSRPLADEEVFSDALPEVVADVLANAVPMLRLLAALPGGEQRATWLRD
jgi:uncharacterized protein (TIGR02453 family)